MASAFIPDAIDFTALRSCKVALRPARRNRLSRESSRSNILCREFAGAVLRLLRVGAILFDQPVHSLIGARPRFPVRLDFPQAGDRAVGARHYRFQLCPLPRAYLEALPVDQDGAAATTASLRILLAWLDVFRIGVRNDSRIVDALGF